MAISFKKYVDITSGVGGGSAVRQRDLIGRIFTSNNLLPPGTIREFPDADAVGEYFGTSSDEYKRAQFYFSWISPLIVRAKKISFARWVNAAVAPRIFGAKGDQALASYTSISAGAFVLTIGSRTENLTAIDFSSAASLTDVATVIQTKIRSITAGGAQWTAATVTWNATRKSFDFVGGAVGDAVISVQAGGGGADVAAQIGWLNSVQTILADGSAVETVTNVLTETTDVSNNFGSFLFMPDLTQDQVVEAATWNEVQNVMFMFMVRCNSTNAAALSAALIDIGGTGLTLAPIATEYPEMAPMIMLAATDYTKRNSVMSYMYKEFALTPSVTLTNISDSYDSLRVNYYGITQTAGQIIDFYQRGVLMGQATDPVDMNVYANEQWLKDAAGADIMELLVSLARVSANARGRAQIITTLQGVITRALFNGTISVGKTLNNTQKNYITELTGDELAWYQVQNIGYWLDCVIEQVETQDGRVEYKAVYTLIYSKDDAIRKVDGTHVLI